MRLPAHNWYASTLKNAAPARNAYAMNAACLTRDRLRKAATARHPAMLPNFRVTLARRKRRKVYAFACCGNMHSSQSSGLAIQTGTRQYGPVSDRVKAESCGPQHPG